MKFEKSIYFVLILIHHLILPVSCYANTVVEDMHSTQQLHLSYTDLANQYYIVAQTAGLLPDFFINPEYRKRWEENYGQNSHDEIGFQKLKKIYERLQPFVSKYLLFMALKSGLFAPEPEDFSDPLLNAFFTNSTFNDAVQKLSSILTLQEMMDVNENLPMLLEKAAKLVNLDLEKTNSILTQLNALLINEAVDEHLGEFQNFYQSSQRPLRAVQLVFEPSDPSLTTFGGFCIGDVLILRVPDHVRIEKNSKTLHMLVSVLIHEAVHHISGSVPNSQKRALTLGFFWNGGRIGDENPLFVIEEPLAAASQMYFLKYHDPEFYSENDEWFDDSKAARIFFKMLEEYVPAGKNLDIDFLKRYLEFKNEQ